MPCKRVLNIRRRALRIQQTAKHRVYLFALTGEELLRIAAISRISRDQAGKLVGYQRSSVRQHIRNIVEYLDSDEALFPNSLILAFSSKVRFHPSRHQNVTDPFGAMGTIEIPVPRNGQQRPGWIVDGQQRAIALSMARRKNFPVPVSGFVVDDLSLQRDQFIRINSTKPLPRGLITELLPEIKAVLPRHLTTRRVASALCDLLNGDPESPFYQLIRRISMGASGRRAAVISDTAFVQMLEHSLATPSGCLFPYRNLATGELDIAGIRSLLFVYWGVVKETFPEAWGLPPTQSRLMHGAGIRAVGRLMDRMMSAMDVRSRHVRSTVRRDLTRIRPVCRWTAGAWEELGGLRWNELQNVPSHIRRLSAFLARACLETRNA